jgi:hypothetical protein
LELTFYVSTVLVDFRGNRNSLGPKIAAGEIRKIGPATNVSMKKENLDKNYRIGCH